MLPSGGDSWGAPATGLDVLDAATRAGGAAAAAWMQMAAAAVAQDEGLNAPAAGGNAHGRGGRGGGGGGREPAATGPLVQAPGPRHRSSVKTSTYRGVAATDNGTWRARIRFGKYTVHLGRCELVSPARPL